MFRDGIVPVEVTVVEIPARHRDRLIGTVKTESDRSAFGVDCGDGGEVAVEDPEPGPVLETHHTVPGLEGPVDNVKSRSVERRPASATRTRACQLSPSTATLPVTDGKHLGWATDGLDVAVPVLHGPVDGVTGGGRDVDPVTPFVHRNGTVHRPVTKLCEGGSFPFVFLSNDLRQLDRWESGGEGCEEAPCVDLSKLMVVTDQDELPGRFLDEVGDLSELARANHAGLIDHDDRTERETAGDFGLTEEAGEAWSPAAVRAANAVPTTGTSNSVASSRVIDMTVVFPVPAAPTPTSMMLTTPLSPWPKRSLGLNGARPLSSGRLASTRGHNPLQGCLNGARPLSSGRPADPRRGRGRLRVGLNGARPLSSGRPRRVGLPLKSWRVAD